ncbi:hypothetical protein GF402_02305 [Candidatus Fermentibacteria bacterium]|nr:hypothetical protein [Candidatus Fermentibacteria bacterium]
MRARSKYVWMALLLVLPAAFWIASLAVSKQLPLFIDSQIAIGAGARLYHHGHLAETCMIHGLINPYLLEGLLRLGLGAFAPYALRLVQFLIGLGSICAAYRIGLNLDGRSSRNAVLISTALAALCSTIFLVESFELTPENVMTLCLLLLLHRLVVYEPKAMHSVTTGAVMALLIGARPSSFILWVPVILVIPECFPHRAYAARYWRWIVFTVLVIAALLAPFPDAVPIGTVLAICGGLVITVTLICAIRDLRAGFGEVWKNLVLVLLSALLALAILFPNYVIHLGELLRQTSQLHVAIEEPCGSVADYSRQLVYSLFFLVITFPGPLAAVGVFVGIGILSSKRRQGGNYGRLLLFALGTIPFFLLSCRYVNFQSRYLIPLMGTALVVSAIGLRCIMRMGRIRYLLILPMLISVFQLREVVKLRPNGGLLNALSALGR